MTRQLAWRGTAAELLSDTDFMQRERKKHICLIVELPRSRLCLSSLRLNSLWNIKWLFIWHLLTFRQTGWALHSFTSFDSFMLDYKNNTHFMPFLHICIHDKLLQRQMCSSDMLRSQLIQKDSLFSFLFPFFFFFLLVGLSDGPDD